MGCCDSPNLASLTDALTHILAQVSTPLSVESIPLNQSLNRICAETICSTINIPPFDNSAMDGYALAIESLSHSASVEQSQHIMAGSTTSQVLPANHCARIMTGAPIPAGADTVVMQEDVHVSGSRITFPKDIKQGQNIRLSGEDVKQGQQLIKPGTRLTSRHIGLIASLGQAQVTVYNKLRIALISTGDELISPGEKLKAGQIYDSNRLAISALLQPLAVELIDFGVIPDDLTAFRKAFSLADQQADIVICSGGVSVGDADYTKQVLEELGDIKFWKLAIKPGKPFAFGCLPNSDFIGLPGNPVSAFVTAYKLALPILAKAMHWDYQVSPLNQAVSCVNIRKRPGRTDFQRGIATVNQAGQLEVSLTGKQGSGIFTSLSEANCFIVLEQARGNVEQGELVSIEWFNYPL